MSYTVPKPATYVQTATERVHMAKSAAEAIAGEAGLLDARRVFMLVSRSLNQEIDEIKKIIKALGPCFAGLYEGMPAHGPRSAVLDATATARAMGADLIVSVGGGSVTDAAKVMTLCLKHNLKTHEDMEPFHMFVNEDGAVINPGFEGPDIRALCVPTTLSGGEFNTPSGATDERIKLKQGYEHRLMAPIAIILYPAITRHTPEWLWLSTGVRALDHALGGTFDAPHGYTSCVMAPFALAFNESVNGERQRRISAALGQPQEAAHTNPRPIDKAEQVVDFFKTVL